MEKGMISNFICPTEIFLGAGSLKQIKAIIQQEQFRRAMIVTDKGVLNAGLIQPILAQLSEVNCEASVFDGVEPNPTDVVVNQAFVALTNERPDLLIAVGGGSSMDTAKAIGILATNGGDIIDYRGVGKVKEPILPVVAIPTTAGTGSEVTTVTVITDTKMKLKYSVGGRNVAARWALVDPELTLTVPPHVTAATGVDALTHAIEAFTSKMSYSVTDSLAKESIRMISENLRTAVYQGNNLEARSKMLEGSLIAGLAFNNAKLGLCHALCNPLGAHFNVPHGVANAILLPHSTRFNLPARTAKYAEVARLMGESTEGLSLSEAAEKAVSAIERLIKDVNVPAKLSQVGVTEDFLPRMVEECADNPLVSINPRTATKDDLLQIYKNAF